ncbi:M20/M25/M40 family metallo-hydrolase [Halospeciosus flavus]|uniref:M20/M25/M40 family metallo-hydrolase n=1 Tax=Halospeciosus flavus TaxID=3032283 RepID=A0ABD5Z4R6_9EURY|nr:M20/M25/M40 family metallo-hydrolase [Halospeciosus flavus]
MSDFDPVDFLERAVQTPSHEDVDAMRELLVDELDAHGVTPEVDDAGNVLATTGEEDQGGDSPHYVLNTHIDTVPPHLDFDREDGVIRGRGSCDAKGPLAALLAGFLAVDPDKGRVTLAVTPDEETESLGADALVCGGALDDADVDGYVVGEPTGLDPCTAARGRFQCTVHLRGSGAHAADPESGVNAVAALEQTLAAIRTFDEEHGPNPHPILGPPTLTPTQVEGGEASNRIPSDASLVLDRRTVPPETEHAFFEALPISLREQVPDEVGLDVEPAERSTPFLEAFDTDDDSAVVEALVEAGAGDPRAFGAATEASYFAKNAPTVVFGPGDLSDEEGAVAHSEREYVRVDEVEDAADIVTAALRRLVG